jgi:hypothetical protein
MGAVDLNLGGLIPDSLFVDDGAVAQANANALTTTAQIQADADLQATIAQTDLIKQIAIILAIVFLIFALLWFFK